MLKLMHAPHACMVAHVLFQKLVCIRAVVFMRVDVRCVQKTLLSEQLTRNAKLELVKLRPK